MDTSTVVAVTYAHSAVITFVDWTLAAFPIIVVWNMTINWPTKVALALVLSLGSMYVYPLTLVLTPLQLPIVSNAYPLNSSCIATIARIPYIHVLENLSSLFDDTNLAAWSVIEVGMALIACSAATLRPLIRRMTDSYGCETH